MQVTNGFPSPCDNVVTGPLHLGAGRAQSCEDDSMYLRLPLSRTLRCKSLRLSDSCRAIDHRLLTTVFKFVHLLLKHSSSRHFLSLLI